MANSSWRSLLKVSLSLITWFSFSQLPETQRPSDPYEEFLAEQKKRNREWKSEREAKRAKAQSVTPPVKQNDASSQEDPVTLLRQQLASKAEECCELKNKLKSIKAVNNRILRNQKEMQENFVKVHAMFLRVM